MTITSVLTVAFGATATVSGIALQFIDSIPEAALLTIWGGVLLLFARQFKHRSASVEDRVAVAAAPAGLSLAETK